MTTPTPGRIVLYTLTEEDVVAVNRRRDDWTTHNDPESASTGYVAHVGNTVTLGDVYPAMIVRVWQPGATISSVNLQVHLDGNDTYWAPSRGEGKGPGMWAWPERGGM